MPCMVITIGRGWFILETNVRNEGIKRWRCQPTCQKSVQPKNNGQGIFFRRSRKSTDPLSNLALTPWESLCIPLSLNKINHYFNRRYHCILSLEMTPHMSFPDRNKGPAVITHQQKNLKNASFFPPHPSLCIRITNMINIVCSYDM